MDIYQICGQYSKSILKYRNFQVKLIITNQWKHVNENADCRLRHVNQCNIFIDNKYKAVEIMASTITDNTLYEYNQYIDANSINWYHSYHNIVTCIICRLPFICRNLFTNVCKNCEKETYLCSSCGFDYHKCKFKNHPNICTSCNLNNSSIELLPNFLHEKSI